MHFLPYLYPENVDDQASMCPSSFKDYNVTGPNQQEPMSTFREKHKTTDIRNPLNHIYQTSPSLFIVPQKVSDTTMVHSAKLSQHQTLGQIMLRYLLVKRFTNRVLSYVKPKEQDDTQLLDQGESIWCIPKQMWNAIEMIPLVSPQHPLKISWDTILALVRCYFLIILPLQVAASGEQLFQTQQLLANVFGTLLVCDYLLRFNTVYFDQGRAVTNRQAIITRQVNRNLVVEIFSLIPLFLGNSIFSSVILILFFLQYPYVPRAVRQYQDTFDLSRTVTSLLDLFRLITTVAYIAHLFACLWFYLGRSALDTQTGWLHVRALDHSSWQSQYLQALYFSTVTMFTIGYGDITPQTTLETISVIAYILFSSVQLSYSVSTVGAIINDLTVQAEQVRLKLKSVNNYMHKQGIGMNLQYEVRAYLDYFWKQDQQSQIEQQKQLVQCLPAELKERLQAESNRIILSCPVLSGFSERFRQKLLKIVVETVYKPNETMDQGDSLFIVKEGAVEVYVPNRHAPKSKRKILSNGQCFNDITFINPHIQEPYRYKSVGFTTCLILRREEFVDLMVSNYKSDYERFCTIREEKQKRTQPINEVAIKRHAFPIDQQRERHSRKGRANFNALLDQSFIEEICECLQMENPKAIAIYGSVAQLDNHAYSTAIQSKQGFGKREDQQKFVSTIQEQDDSSSGSSETSITISSSQQIEIQASLQRLQALHTGKQPAQPRRQSMRLEANRHFMQRKMLPVQKMSPIKKLEGLSIVAKAISKLKKPIIDKIDPIVHLERKLQLLRKHPHMIKSNSIEDFHLLIIRLKHSGSGKQFQQLMDFDIQRNYDNYNPDHNLQSILTSKRQGPTGRLIQYMMYPMEYYKQFRQNEFGKKVSQTLLKFQQMVSPRKTSIQRKPFRQPAGRGSKNSGGSRIFPFYQNA